MPQITQLDNDPTPNNNDLLVTVDMAAGTTKNISREQFFTGAPLPANTVDSQALADTGWQPIPAAPGYTSSALYRVVSGTVHLRGSFSTQSGNVSSGDTLGTLPNGVRPAGGFIFNGIGSGSSTARTSIETNGELKVLTTPTVNSNIWRYDNTSFLID